MEANFKSPEDEDIVIKVDKEQTARLPLLNRKGRIRRVVYKIFLLLFAACMVNALELFGNYNT